MTDIWRDWKQRQIVLAEDNSQKQLESDIRRIRHTAFYGMVDDGVPVKQAADISGIDIKNAEYMIKKRKRKNDQNSRLRAIS